MVARAAAGPIDDDLGRSLLQAEAEVQRQIVLTAAAGAGFHLAREGLAAGFDDDLGADRRTVALARALQPQLEVIVFCRRPVLAERIDPHPAAGAEIEKPN